MKFTFRLIIGIIILAAIIAWGIMTRLHDAEAAKDVTNRAAIPTVNVLKVDAGMAGEDVTLPGTVRPDHEAGLFARTNGYVKTWHTDIGARVRAGDLLAEIDTPDVEAQLHQAEADLKTAEANNAQAQITAERFQSVTNKEAVSKQEVDQAVNAASAAASAVASARANMDRLHEMAGFRRIVAPFDGVISARNTDNGALINAGSGAAPMELFHIVDARKLRVDIDVPESYAADITPDMVAELHFAEYPDRTFPAALARTADALNPSTRTLMVEFEMDNSNGELKSGGFTKAHLRFGSAGGNIHLPVNTLLFRDKTQVAVVDDQDRVQLKDITIGRDYGKAVEVLTGLQPGETVIVNPPDSLESGQQVNIAKAAAPTQK